MTNAWDDVASEQIVAPRKARMRAAATRAERKRQKELQERDMLFRLWRKWHQERKDELLKGAWSKPAQKLAAFLEHMTIEDAPALISLVEQGPWRNADDDTRFLVLELISMAIVFLRENHGLYPFDDPLPDDEPNAFLRIRELLR